MTTKAMIVLPTLTAGGAERVASILANEWSRYPNTTVTFVFLFDDSMFFSLAPSVRVLRIGLKPGVRSPVRRTWALVRALVALRRLVLQESPTFILSMMHKYNVFCLASLWGTGFPVVVSERDHSLQTPRWIDVLRRLVYRRARAAITQTEVGRRFLIETTGLVDVAALPNPVEVTYRAAPARDTIILNVSRLVKGKGHADLLKAFASSRLSPGWRLVLCGDGPERQSLESLARNLGIADRVHFAGLMDPSEWYSRASIFAFSSYSEGFPNALAEAMMSGLAVVSYECPTGPSEMIKNGHNGFLVPVGNVSCLTKRLEQLAADPALVSTFSRAAAETAAEWKSSVVAKRYFTFCCEAATRPERDS